MLAFTNARIFYGVNDRLRRVIVTAEDECIANLLLGGGS